MMISDHTWHLQMVWSQRTDLWQNLATGLLCNHHHDCCLTLLNISKWFAILVSISYFSPMPWLIFCLVSSCSLPDKTLASSLLCTHYHTCCLTLLNISKWFAILVSMCDKTLAFSLLCTHQHHPIVPMFKYIVHDVHNDTLHYMC